MPRAFDLELERRWRERLREFERSGLAVREFCRSHALREHTFFWWRRALAQRDRVRQTARSVSRRSPQHPAAPRPSHRRRAVGESSSHNTCLAAETSITRHRRRAVGESSSHAGPLRRVPAFLPVELVAEPIAASCIEFRFGTCLVRVPTTIDERALRQAIRVVREEVVGRTAREEAGRRTLGEVAAC